MQAYRVSVDGYPDESFAYVLAESPAAAIDFMRGEFEDGYGEVVASREPKLDGDEITDQSLYQSGLGFCSCTRCDRYTDGWDGFHDEEADTYAEPIYDDYGRMYCSKSCRDQEPRFVQPGHQSYVMLGTEF